LVRANHRGLERLEKKISEPYGYTDPKFVWTQVSEKHQMVWEPPTADENNFVEEVIEINNV